jgi:hypothetical protein
VSNVLHGKFLNCDNVRGTLAEDTTKQVETTRRATHKAHARIKCIHMQLDEQKS